MPHDYVPRPDAAFYQWARNLTDKLSAEREAYHVSQETLDELVAANDAFAAAYLAIDSGNRCKSLTQRKNDARRVLELIGRQCAKWVTAQPDVSAQMKMVVGLSLRGRGGWNPRQQRPSGEPRVMVRKVHGPVVHVWLIDRESGRHARPSGVWGAALYAASGEHIGENAVWQFVGVCTGEMAIDLTRLGLPPGSRVWLRACWFNNHGAGRLCEPKAARLGDGMVMPSVAA